MVRGLRQNDHRNDEYLFLIILIKYKSAVLFIRPEIFIESFNKIKNLSSSDLT